MSRGLVKVGDSLLPFTKETDAHPGRLPLAVPVRGRLGFGIFGVEHTPVVPMRFVHLSVPVLTSSSWLQAPAFSEGHRAGSAVADRSRSEACERISWPGLRIPSRATRLDRRMWRLGRQRMSDRSASRNLLRALTVASCARSREADRTCGRCRRRIKYRRGTGGPSQCVQQRRGETRQRFR